MNYFITRHPGALQWLQQCNLGPAQHFPHLEERLLNSLTPADVVIGTLPVSLVAEVNRRGARYLHLRVDMPPALRGQELDIAQLHDLGAELVEYVVHQPLSEDAVSFPLEMQEDWP